MKLFLLILSTTFGSYYGAVESYLARFSQDVVIKAEPPTEIVRTSVPLSPSKPITIVPDLKKTASPKKPVQPITKKVSPQAPKIKGEDDPRAIKSLFNKNYDGKNFKIVEELDRTDFSRNYSISYEGDGLTLSGTLHVPYLQGKGPFPLIVLNRGFYPTIVYSNGFGFSFEQDYFARRGYVALHLDFRGYGFSENRADYIRGRGLN